MLQQRQFVGVVVVWSKLILLVVGDLAKRKITIHNRQFECLVDFNQTFNNLRLSLFPPLWNKITFTACHRRNIKLRGCVSLNTVKTGISWIHRKIDCRSLRDQSRPTRVRSPTCLVSSICWHMAKKKKKKIVSQSRTIETINVVRRD